VKLSLSGTPLIWNMDHGALVTHARRAADAGYFRYHLAEAPTGGFDVLTALVAIGVSAPELRVASAIVPTWPRHPMVIAAQTITAQNILGGRLTLGLGLSHEPMITEPMGIAFDRPVRHLIEYLDVLVPLLAGEDVDYRGELVRLSSGLTNRPEHPTDILVAALGAQTLRVTGSRVAGTTLTWVGANTIRDHVVPTISDAARRADRPAPEVVASLPVSVTSRAEEVRDRAQGEWGYARMPSYLAMFEREGVAGAGDLVLIGDEDEVTEQLGTFAAVGVTEFVAKEFTPFPEDGPRTRALLDRLAGEMNGS